MKKRRVYEKTAIHEAGHAVASVIMGVIGMTATIVPDREKGNLGSVVSENDDTHDTFIYLAGYAAVRVHLERLSLSQSKIEIRACEGCNDDFEKAEENCKRLGLGFEDEKRKTVAVMREPKNRASVLRVARELQDRKTLQWEAVQILTEIGQGEATEKNWLEHCYIMEQWSEKEKE